jgi:uncharacterized repeat protein (TIGR01451 family)
MENLTLTIKRWQYGYKELSKKALRKAYKKRSLLGKVGILLMVFGLLSNMLSLPLIYAADTAARLVGEGANGTGTKILKVWNGTEWVDELTNAKAGDTINLRALAYNDAHVDVVAKDIMSKFNPGAEGSTEIDPSVNFNSVNAGIVNGYSKIGINNTDTNKKYKLVVNKVVVRELKENEEQPERTLTQAETTQLLGSGYNLGDLNGGQAYNKRLFINATLAEVTTTSQAELALTLTSDKSKIQPGENVTYTVKVKNTKELPAVNARIASTLETATYANPNTVVTGHTYQNGSLQFAANSQKFAQSQVAVTERVIMVGLNQPLAGGETVEYSYTVKTDKVGENAGMRNTTEAQAENSNLVSANNLVSIETGAANAPKLNLLVVATPHFNVEGKVSEHNVTVTLSNTGNTNATNVSLDIDHILNQTNKGTGTATYKAGSLQVSNAQGVSFNANDPTQAMTVANLAQNGSVSATYVLTLNDKYVKGDQTIVKAIAQETVYNQKVEAQAVIDTMAAADVANLQVTAKIVETNGNRVDKTTRKPGEEVKIEATLTNKGIVDVTNYRISETIDSRIQNVKIDRAIPAANTLKPNESVTYTYAGTLDNSTQTFPAGQTISLTENYFKAHAGNVQEVTSNKVTVDVTREAQQANAKLTIKAVIIDGNNEVTEVNRKPGEEVKMKVTVTNTGSEVAKGYHVDTNIDSRIVSVKAQGVSASQMDLAPQATDIKFYTGNVKSDLTGNHEITSNFKASAQNVSEVTSNNVIVKVAAGSGTQAPAFELKQTVDKAKAEPGEELTYTITYKNTTGKVAKDVVISEKLSSYVDYVSTTGKNVKDAGNNTIVFTVGDLQPDQSGEIIVKAKIKQSTPVRTLVVTTANATYKDPEGKELAAGPASATTEVVGKTAGTTPDGSNNNNNNGTTNDDGGKSGDVNADREGALSGVTSTPKTGSSTFSLALFIATIGTLVALAGYVIYAKAKRLNTLKLDFVNFA